MTDNITYWMLCIQDLSCPPVFNFNIFCKFRFLKSLVQFKGQFKPCTCRQLCKTEEIPKKNGRESENNEVIYRETRTKGESSDCLETDTHTLTDS